MKKIILALCFIVLGIPQIYSQDISGSWRWNYNNGKHMTVITLSDIGNDNYSGRYCSVFFNGRKIDCSSDDSEICLSVSKVSTNIYEGPFESPAYSGSGKVRITFFSQSLSPEIRIEIISSDGEFYLPNDVVFNK